MKLSVGDNLIASNIKVANTFFARLIGLLGKKNIDESEGLLLTKCSSVHCLFMKFAIDAVYLSKDMKVLYIETINPWKIGKFMKGAYNVLELKEGKASEISVGDVLSLAD